MLHGSACRRFRAGNGRDGNYTWCPQWWRHHGPSVRLALIHRAFEVARRSDDTTDGR
ncbi:DUF4913 domain-containing protein, partial [Nocardia farcinica]|uniref:DUF4913 domain-containing protein n=1 Tax=Nocardia farcinica TaxID=37329 RepID=UPI0011458A7C